MLQQLPIGRTPWPADAIHDTVAAVMRQRAYQRSIRSSLFERFIGWITELLQQFFASVSQVPYAKWIVLALAILVVAGIVLRLALVRDSEERRARAARRSRAVVGADPWADAERLAAAGNHTEAAHALYRALIETLASRQLLRLHPSKTSGDYARDLRARGSAAHADFRQFARRYDRGLFGLRSFDADSYAALREQALRLAADRERAA